MILSDEHGPERARMVLGRLERRGDREAADLAALDPHADAARLGLEPATVERLRRLGERGLNGAFGAELLRSMPVDAARNWLCDHAEVGATTADLVLMRRRPPRRRPRGEPRSCWPRSSATTASRAARPARRLDELGQRWGEFASWAAYLLVEAARRDGRAADRAAVALATLRRCAQVSAAPMRSTVVGWVPNSSCTSRGGSGSETLSIASLRSTAMNAAGSSVRSSA